MNRQSYANNMNTNVQYSTDTMINTQNQYMLLNQLQSNQNGYHDMKDLSSQTNLSHYGNNRNQLNNAKFIHQDQCQHQYKTPQDSFQIDAQNDIPQFENFHPSFQNSFLHDDSNPFIGESLNDIHGNIQDDHIGLFYDVSTANENIQQQVYRLQNLEGAEHSPLISQFNAQYNNNFQTVNSKDKIVYSNFSSQNQQYQQTPLYSNQMKNAQTFKSCEKQGNNFNQQKLITNYPYNQLNNSLLYQPEQLLNTQSGQVIQKSLQQYSETSDYNSRDNVFENYCSCDQSSQEKSRIADESQAPTNPYRIQENMVPNNLNCFKEQANFQLFEEKNINQNTNQDFHQENQSYLNKTNYQDEILNTYENIMPDYMLQNGIYENESCSKSEQSDEQFLMNHVFSDNQQSSIMDDNDNQNQIQINQNANHLFNLKQEIVGQNGTQECQKQLKFAKNNVQQLENYGDLPFHQISLKNQGQIKITGQDQQLNKQLKSDTNQYFQIQQTNQIYQRAEKEEIQNSPTAAVQQNISSSQLNFQKQQGDTFDIIHLDKKNIVRNLIRAFIRFLFCRSSFPYIHKTYFQNQTENETKQQLKKYFTKKKFNNYVVKQIVQHTLYGNIFKYFLEKEAMNYLQHSNVKCKQNHQTFIQFLMKCYDDNNLLENLECYVKNKKI